MNVSWLISNNVEKKEIEMRTALNSIVYSDYLAILGECVCVCVRGKCEGISRIA